jgi:hypothetical protein
MQHSRVPRTSDSPVALRVAITINVGLVIAISSRSRSCLLASSAHCQSSMHKMTGWSFQSDLINEANNEAIRSTVRKALSLITPRRRASRNP